MADSSLTADRIALRSIRFHWRIAVSVALGVAVATAVITGALLVGDSMRGSLRDLTEQRLGKIDFAVFPGGFFDPDGWLAEQTDVVGEPVVYFSRGVLETKVSVELPGEPEPQDRVRRAGAVQILATDPSFWDLDRNGVRPQQMPGPNSVVLNAAAAAEIGVQVGDQVTVRLPAEQAVPADSPLGRNEAESEGLPRMEVVDVIPTRGLGRFALSPSQAEPLNVYLSRELVGEVLAREGQANVLLIDAAGASDDLASAQQQADTLQQSLRPQLSDYGLQLEHVQRSFDDVPVIDYYSLSSERLLVADAVRQAVVEELGAARVHPVMTYLANKIQRSGGGAEAQGEPVVVPYSTLTAIDSLPDLPLNYAFPAGLQDVGEAIPLVLNSWAAERLDAAVGERLRVTYFEPETVDGQEIARHFEAILTDIVPLTPPARPYSRRQDAVFEQRPTVYNDPDLTPTVPGVTDQDSILNWDLPFQLEDGLVQDEDDAYWNDHRLTPKAFIPLAAGQRLFGSRFGDTTSLRIEAAEGDDLTTLTTAIERSLLQHKHALGFEVQPIHAQQMAASTGTTPFDVLFLMLSMFVIFAALMLIALLLRLGLLARSREYGTLLATGWSGAAAARLATREGMLAAVAGALLGVALGVGYAWLVLWALRTWWVGAVTVPFLQFHGSLLSLLGGLLAGTLSAWATIRFTTRQLRRTPPRTLLAGQFGDSDSEPPNAAGGRGWLRPLAWGLIAISVLLGAVATQLGGQSQAGAFVGGGMLLLIGTLVWLYARLRQTARDPSGHTRATDSLWRLAIGNARRNPLRSTLTIGLMASACFLILAMSAFQLSPTDAGVGGFDLIGQTAQPYFRELSDPLVQKEVFGNERQHLAGATLVSLRMRPGQDASCNNLYKAAQPTVLGVPERLAALYETEPWTPFAWAASADLPADQSPWRALERPAAGTADDPVPMVLDQATAMWALQIYGGVGATTAFEFDDGQTRHFEVVGLLSNSVLQGVVMIGEANFKTEFPQISGDQYFLIQAPPAQREPLIELLENRLGDVGMDITDSRTVLARLLAVQNTYLRTFQSLGALGLLLGTIGLAIAQLRSVLERRGELAVMRAIGFTRWRLAQGVMMEHAALLLAGIGSGVFAALLAVVPYAWLGRAQLPLAEPLAWMVAVLAVGMLAGVTVLSRVIRMPLIQSLRSQ